MDNLISTLMEETPDVIYHAIPIIAEGYQLAYSFISMITFML